MKKFLSVFISCVLLVLPISALAKKHPHKTLERGVYLVSKVMDGDTIKLNNGEKVRLIGVDAPETKVGAKLEKDLKQRRLTKKKELSMGHKSYKFTQRLIEGKKVRLEFDQQKYDEYHRVLAYVYLTNGVFVNAEIVKSGYAYAYAIKPNLRYSKMLGKLYVDAREDRRGLWQNSAYRSKSIKRFSAK